MKIIKLTKDKKEVWKTEDSTDIVKSFLFRQKEKINKNDPDTKPACIIIDYMLPSGEYKWIDVYMTVDPNLTSVDYFKLAPWFLEQLDIDKNAKAIGMQISYEFLDMEKLQDPSKADEIKQQYFTPLFFYPEHYMDLCDETMRERLPKGPVFVVNMR